MKASFTGQSGPMVIGVIREKNAREVIAAIRNGEVEGATGFDVHLSCLLPEERTEEKLREIFSATSLPIMALHYKQNYDWSTQDCTDEERVALLLLAIKAGASAIDMQGYTFGGDTKASFREPWLTEETSFAAVAPCEVTIDPAVIQKQMDLIDEVHRLGGEVVLSTHTWVPMNCEQVTALARFLEKRHPDLIKIVTPCENDEQLAECFKTTLTLKKELHTKYSYHCCGQAGKISRIVCPMLGSYLAFCSERYTYSGNLEQLHLKTTADAFRTLQWR